MLSFQYIQNVSVMHQIISNNDLTIEQQVDQLLKLGKEYGSHALDISSILYFINFHEEFKHKFFMELANREIEFINNTMIEWGIDI